jgi:hypothetical protein
MAEPIAERVYRVIAAHGPLTSRAIATELGGDVAALDEHRWRLIGAGRIVVAGHDPSGAPLYTAA